MPAAKPVSPSPGPQVVGLYIVACASGSAIGTASRPLVTRWPFIVRQVDERYMQKQLGHASAEMTRRYQRRRDRLRVNLTKTRRP